MKKILAVLIVLFFTPLAFAEGTAWNEHHGPYAEFTAGTNLYYLGVISSAGKVAGAGVAGASLGAALGYSYTPYYGLEGGLLTALVDLNRGNQIYAPYISTRWTLPLGNRFSLLAKLGLMVPFVPRDGGVILPLTGVGASYAVTEKMDLGLQYQGAIYGIAGAGNLGVSLTYHF
jgi:opacity protein-like surface antigen